jgi:hypothetical protein
VDARAKAKDLLARVRLGQDPANEIAEERRSMTVAQLVQRYQDEAGVGRKPKTKTLYEGYFRLHVIPEIGTMKARDVKRSDIARLHRKVGATHKITANRIVTVLGRFYRWAGSIGAVPEGHNPATGIERYRESGRERYLTTEELQRLGAAIREAETIGIPWEDIYLLPWTPCWRAFRIFDESTGCDLRECTPTRQRSALPPARDRFYRTHVGRADFAHGRN